MNELESVLLGCISSMNEKCMADKGWVMHEWEKRFKENLEKAKKSIAKIRQERADIIFDLVSNKPLKLANIECPFCSSKNIKKTGSSSTLLGGPEGTNHVWNHCSCNDCSKKFTHEHKHGYAWYVDENSKVLSGIPCCFEDYVLECKFCRGDVRRTYLKNGQPVKTLGYKIENNKTVPEQDCFWTCSACDKFIEYPSEYWNDYESSY